MSNELRFLVHLDSLVGRDQELRILSEALLSTTDSPRPVAVTGMAGIGKTALVEWFAKQHAERFPGGYVRLSASEVQPDDRAFIAALVAHLALSPSEEDQGEPVRRRLLNLRTLLHIEDVDTRPMALAVAALVRRLRGCAAVVTGRFEALGAGSDWVAIRLGPIGPAEALELLAREHQPAADVAEEMAQRALAAAFEGSPLALRLGARLLKAGTTTADLLSMLEERGTTKDDQPP